MSNFPIVPEYIDKSAIHLQIMIDYQQTFSLPQTQMLKFVLPPTRNLNASQWIIGCVGSPGVRLTLGMYNSCCLCQFRLHWVVEYWL